MAKKLTQLTLAGLLIVLFIWLNVYIISHPELITVLQTIGPIGLFLLSIMSGFNVVVPIPVSVLYPSFVAIGYAPVMVIGIIAVGTMIGDTLGFLIGRAGKQFLPDNRIAKKFLAFTTEHPHLLMVMVFCYGMLVPMPNELIVIPLAALGVPWYKVLVPLFFGSTIFITIIALGADQITGLFL